MQKPYEPSGFWEKTHSEVPAQYAGRGEGIRSVGGGSNAREAVFLYRLREAALRRALAKARKAELARKTEKIFEFGCGNGYWLDAMPSLVGTDKFQYTGADISPTATQRLAERYPEFCFVCLADAERGWEKIAARGPFDLTLAIDVLYHVTGDAVWESSLRRMGSVTAPGGLFVFSDYGYHEPKANPSRSHVKHRAAQQYLDLLEECRFSVVGIVPEFYFFNRIKYGPWRDHGALGAAAWRIADSFPPAMHLMYWADRVIAPSVRPMNPRCKTRLFVCRKSTDAE